MKARLCIGIAALALYCAGTSPAQAQLAPALEYAWSLNLEAFNRKDIDAAMATIDSRSPDYAATKQALESLFKDHDLSAEVVKFQLVGHDDEFAIARIKTKTVGKPDSGFSSNIVDAMAIFHQENGTWKLWSEEILAVEMIP